jgi:DNA excision repair protein ERCC-2
MEMSMFRKSICPLVVTKGSDQAVITSRFEKRDDPAVTRYSKRRWKCTSHLNIHHSRAVARCCSCGERRLMFWPRIGPTLHHHRDYGELLIEIATYVPDGVVCFFTSYMYMERIVQEWDKLGVLRQVRGLGDVSCQPVPP